MSPCVSRRHTDGYTQTLRRTQTQHDKVTAPSTPPTLFCALRRTLRPLSSRVRVIVLSQCDKLPSSHNIYDLFMFFLLLFVTSTSICPWVYCCCCCFTYKPHPHVFTISVRLSRIPHRLWRKKKNAREISHLDRQHGVCWLLQG